MAIVFIYDCSLNLITINVTKYFSFFIAFLMLISFCRSNTGFFRYIFRLLKTGLTTSLC